MTNKAKTQTNRATMQASKCFLLQGASEQSKLTFHWPGQEAGL